MKTYSIFRNLSLITSQLQPTPAKTNKALKANDKAVKAKVKAMVKAIYAIKAIKVAKAIKATKVIKAVKAIKAKVKAIISVANGVSRNFPILELEFDWVKKVGI